MSSKPATTGRSWWLPVLVVVAALAAIALLLWPTGDDSDAEEPAADISEEQQGEAPPVEVVDPENYEDPEQPDLTYVEGRDPEDPLAVGPADAPVVLVVFSDYQCPYCAAWSTETLPEMLDYVEAGDLRIEWRDLNVFGPASVRASQAAYAAAVQGSFWEFHEELFDGGEQRPESELSEEALISLAAELGLDTEQFTQDMNSPEVEEQVTANQQLGTDLGVYSTPAFLLAGDPMVGAQPTETFTDAVDEALEAEQE